MPILRIDARSVLLEQVIVVTPCCLLEQMDGLRIVQVFFLVAPFLVPAHTAQTLVHAQIIRVKCTLVHGHAALCDIIQINTAHTADSIREVFVHNAFADAQCLENLRTLVGLDGGNTHFRCDLDDTRNQCVNIRLACLGVILIHQATVNHIIQGIQCQIRIDCACAKAQQRCEMMHLARLCGLDDKRNCSVLSGAYQIGLQGSHCKQRRDRQMIVVYATVCQNQNRCTLGVCLFCLLIQVFDGIVQGNVLGIQHGDICSFQSVNIHATNLHQIQVRQNRVVDFQYPAVPLILFQDVAGNAQINRGIRDNRFSDGVDRRIGYLCEHLLEVVEQRRILFGHRRDRCICTHCRSRLAAVQCHRHHHVIQRFISIAKRTLQPEQFLAAVAERALVRHFQFAEAEQVVIQPLAVGLTLCIVIFQALIVDQLALDGIYQQHLARMETLFLYDLFCRDIVQCADLRGQDQTSVIGHIVPGRTQTVSVQDSAHDITIGEDDGCRTVPGFHHSCIVLIERTLFPAHSRDVLPRFRNGHHYCQRQIHAGHGHEFQCVVQTGRVRATHIQHGENILHAVIQCLAVENVLTAQHLIHVTGNGVDLTVVYHHTVRVRTLPAGVGVGAETGVDNTDCRMIIRAVQIVVEQTELFYQEHTFIYNGTAGAGHHIGLAVPLFEYHPCNVQLPVKFQTLCTVLRLFDECLHDVRHTVQCLCTQNIRIYWHFTPAQKFQVFLFQHLFKGLHCLFILFLGLRKEEHCNTIFPLVADGDACLFGYL